MKHLVYGSFDIIIFSLLLYLGSGQYGYTEDLNLSLRFLIVWTSQSRVARVF
jgi:hypothetical protein